MITRFKETNLTGPSRPKPNQEVSRLLAAAVISAQFRQMLLTNPEKAISNGYAGESFHLAQEDRKRLAAIRANDLVEFALQANALVAHHGVAGYGD